MIWWRREGLPFEDAPISEWPEWLLEEAMAACGPRGMRVDPPDKKARCEEVVHIGRYDSQSHLAALQKMDPVDWRGDFRVVRVGGSVQGGWDRAGGFRGMVNRRRGVCGTARGD